MKFCLISGKKGEDVKDVFINQAKNFFDTVVYAPISKIKVSLEDQDPKLFYKNYDLKSFDAIYVRIFEDDYMFGEIILDILEKSDVYMPTGLDGYQITNHKFYSVQMVSKIGVPVPDSSLTISPESSMIICKKMGFPIVLKLLRGFGGKGVMLINSEEELRPVLDTLNVLDELLSAQKFIPNLQTDTRALIIGDEIIGIRRKGTGSEWRANVSTGGSAEIIELDDNLKEIAKSVSEMLRLDVCAVDFIETDKEPIFIEANFTPGIMEKYFDSKLADSILSYIKKKAERKNSDKE